MFQAGKICVAYCLEYEFMNLKRHEDVHEEKPSIEQTDWKRQRPSRTYQRFGWKIDEKLAIFFVMKFVYYSA
jgi:hypothetical protein